MSFLNKREPMILFLGDLVSFLLALWLMLAVRYWALPSWHLVSSHLLPFSVLFAISVAVFFIAGLYEKHTLILKSRVPATLLHAQMANILLAISFFYLIPYFGITPKTNLFLYLLFSFGLLVWWRVGLATVVIGARKRRPAILIGGSPEAKEVYEEINGNDRYPLKFSSVFDFSSASGGEDLSVKIHEDEASLIVMDLSSEESVSLAPKLYNLIFSKVRFIDMYKMYEEIFDRVPLSILHYTWFIENISNTGRAAYDSIKRIFDISVSVVLGIPTLIITPLVALAIKLEDRGDVFISQDRVGENNKIIRLYKFRSMKGSDGGKWISEGDERRTRVGKFLRKTRIDELPQLWNVLRGDLSLIGPRPDIYDLGMKLASEIPYYTTRNIIRPGLSGWAQINQDKPPQSVEETRLRLSYDLYYIKNRSLPLDAKIALRTLKTILSRAGM